MTLRVCLSQVLFLALLCGGASCGGGDASPTAAHDASASSDGGGGRPCSDVPSFHVGLIAGGAEGLARGEIVDAQPIRKYENDWVVKLTDPDGKVLDGLELTKVEPFMPAHGHDGTFAPVVKETSEPGTYDVKRINLWMKDHWEVRFFVRIGDKSDEVIFHVCVPP